MTKLSEAAKAVQVIKHEGREYRLSPLELSDLAELERWVELRPIESARARIAAYGEDITPELRNTILTEANAESKALTLMSPEFVVQLASLEGTAYCLYLALRKEHPDITRQEAAALISIANLEEWQARIDRASGLAGDAESDPTEKAGPPPAPSTTPASSG